MTITTFGQTQKEKLLQIVAEEGPVFVLGPGCYRVGFDNPDDKGWKDVEHRVADVLARLEPEEQTFLREFFVSKLSDERREQPHDRSAVDHRLERLAANATERREEEEERVHATLAEQGSTPAAATQFAPWRTLLATKLLQAFRHASCCLGLVIGEGRSPVLHWQDATVPTETIAEWSRGEQDGAAGGGDQRRHFLASRQAIRSAARIARAMDRLRRREHLISEEITALQELPIAGLDLEKSVPPKLVDALTHPLDVLLPLRMAAMLQVLDDKCFKPGHEPLRGDNIEWLGDMLWHVLSSDAEVQPSQADLAFYVTLSEQASQGPRDLRRPVYGDRMAEDFDLTRLTTCSQPDDQPTKGDRESLLGTIAMCLLAQYAIVEVAESMRSKAETRKPDPLHPGDLYREDELPYLPAMDRYVLALVGDYGDKLEQALFGLLANKAKFHIGVPVWLSTNKSRQIDWLLMDVQRDASNKPAVKWNWLAEVQEVSGPIVIKLNGCDRSPMGAPFNKGKVADFPFVRGGNERRSARIELAVLYDEHDRLTAMQSFDELIADTNDGGVADGLSAVGKGLTWPDRNWVIMGQRFADWIPRLRLFTHKWIGSKDTKEASPTNYWAIDRSFDWPERSLLESLEITMIKGELRSVVNALTVEAFTDRPSSPVGQRFAELFEQLSRG